MPTDSEEQWLYTPLQQRDQYLQVVINYGYFDALSKTPLINTRAPREHT